MFEIELREFLKSKLRNTWIENQHAKVYIRKAHRRIEKKFTTTLDIATIEVNKPGRGTGTKLIQQFHTAHPFDYTYIENVLNEKFAKHLRLNGWNEIGTEENCGIPSFFKRVKQ